MNVQFSLCTKGFLGHFQTSVAEVFSESSEQLLAGNYFRKKVPSQMLDRIFNASRVYKLYKQTSQLKKDEEQISKINCFVF